MSKMDVLRIAILKLQEAEEATLNVRDAFSRDDPIHNSPDYKLVDSIFEDVGDAATTLEHILGSIEDQELSERVKVNEKNQ